MKYTKCITFCQCNTLLYRITIICAKIIKPWVIRIELYGFDILSLIEPTLVGSTLFDKPIKIGKL